MPGSQSCLSDFGELSPFIFKRALSHENPYKGLEMLEKASSPGILAAALQERVELVSSLWRMKPMGQEGGVAELESWTV